MFVENIVSCVLTQTCISGNKKKAPLLGLGREKESKRGESAIKQSSFNTCFIYLPIILFGIKVNPWSPLLLFPPISVID
jgi:hypothetical protein